MKLNATNINNISSSEAATRQLNQMLARGGEMSNEETELMLGYLLSSAVDHGLQLESVNRRMDAVEGAIRGVADGMSKTSSILLEMKGEIDKLSKEGVRVNVTESTTPTATTTTITTNGNGTAPAAPEVPKVVHVTTGKSDDEFGFGDFLLYASGGAAIGIAAAAIYKNFIE